MLEHISFYVQQIQTASAALYLSSGAKTSTPNNRRETMQNVQHMVQESFQSAIENPENINIDGSINWNYVEADVWLDLSESFDGINEDIEEDIGPLFDNLATEYLKINT